MENRSNAKQRPHPNNKGIVFVIVLAALTGLVLLGLMSMMLTRMERVSAVNFAELTAARILARSGMETAIAYLPQYDLPDKGISPAVYGIEFTDKNNNGRYDPDKDEVISTHPSEALEHTRFPSFKGYGIRPGEKSEIIVKRGIRTETIGLSGSIPSSNAGCLSIYSLRVRDCAGMIYVNGPGVSTDNWALAPNAVRMLNNLGKQFTAPNLGDIISNTRTRQKHNFTGREEIKTALEQNGLKESDYKLIKDYITCFAWVDQQTLLPGALAPINQDGDYKNINRKWSGLKIPGQLYGFNKFQPSGLWLALSPDHILACCPDDYSITNKGFSGYSSKPTPTNQPYAPPYRGRTALIQPRAPININTAPTCVLTAVLEGVSGYYLDRSQKTATSPGNYIRNDKSTISAETAVQLAQSIVNRRNKRVFSSHADFDSFINGLGYLGPEQRMALKTNANPNSRLAKFNPDRTFGLRFGDTDKSDLGSWSSNAGPDADCGWSTEFCFSSMGYYEVESLGQLLAPPDEFNARRVTARSKVTSVLKLYNILRHTTQKDFEKYATVKTGLAIYPESLDNLKSDKSWNNIKKECLDKPESECSHQLCYDGYVSLKPQDIPEAGASCGPTGLANCLLRADFTDTLKAVSRDGDGANYGTADENRSLIDPNDQSELFTDGLFCHETRRAGFKKGQSTYGDTTGTEDEYLAYKADNNFPLKGSLEFWFKPAWDSNDITSDNPADTRALLTVGNGEDLNILGDGIDDRLILVARNQSKRTFLAGHYGTCQQGWYGMRDAQRRHHFPYLMSPSLHSSWAQYGITRSDINWSAGQWHHIAASWNSSSLRLFTDGVEALGSPLINHRDAFPQGILNNWYIYPGNNRFEDKLCNGYPLNADGTIDSFRIYDQEITGPFFPPDRYEDTAGTEFTGRFEPMDFQALKKPGRLGSITWQWMQPTNGSGDIKFEVTANNTTIKVTGQGQDLNLDLTKNDTVTYKARFIAAIPNTQGFIDESPILDEVTIILLCKPEFLSYGTD
ncbi:MAG: LamG-like jellyroll fold domain-containing protein [Candidatus Brocadiia bacterium]